MPTEMAIKNAGNCFESVAGLKFFDLSKDAQIELTKHWAFYVDQGMDFGSAVLRVLKDIEDFQS